jgi:hypothetical protein
MNSIDRIYSDWARIGVALSVRPNAEPVSIELLLLETVVPSRTEPRLFSIAASWLSIHHHLVNARLLGKMLEEVSNEVSAITGALLEVALERSASAKTLEMAIQHCSPAKTTTVLFKQYAENPVLSSFARQESLALFSRWGFWHNEVSLKTDAIRPATWVLQRCPELRLRALLGAGLEAEILALLLKEQLSATDLKKVLPYSYPAIYEATLKLEGRGFIRRANEGRKKRLVVGEAISSWLAAYPSTA